MAAAFGGSLSGAPPRPSSAREATGRGPSGARRSRETSTASGGTGPPARAVVVPHIVAQAVVIVVCGSRGRGLGLALHRVVPELQRSPAAAATGAQGRDLLAEHLILGQDGQEFLPRGRRVDPAHRVLASRRHREEAQYYHTRHDVHRQLRWWLPATLPAAAEISPPSLTFHFTFILPSFYHKDY